MFTKRWLTDVGERTVATFLEAFIGLLILSEWGELNFKVVTSMAGAALISALAVAKGALAQLRGDQDSAGLILPPIAKR